jgi:hypothetical protein
MLDQPFELRALEKLGRKAETQRGERGMSPVSQGWRTAVSMARM